MTQFWDPVLSVLWFGFDPWPGSFHMLQTQGKKKKNKAFGEKNLRDGVKGKL